MKVWVTKYALTSGILEYEGELWDGDQTVAKVKGPQFMNGSCLFHKGEWRPTRDEAVADANRRRDDKLASLDKQRKKIEAMTFA